MGEDNTNWKPTTQTAKLRAEKIRVRMAQGYSDAELKAEFNLEYRMLKYYKNFIRQEILDGLSHEETIDAWVHHYNTLNELKKIVFTQITPVRDDEGKIIHYTGNGDSISQLIRRCLELSKEQIDSGVKLGLFKRGAQEIQVTHIYKEQVDDILRAVLSEYPDAQEKLPEILRQLEKLPSLKDNL